MSSSDDETLRFIAGSFTSVWALELLLSLRRAGGARTREHLVSTLRASELVVAEALDSLVTAGLISVEAGTALYLPANRSVAASVEKTEELYRRKPDAVRREIVGARLGGARAFADAFRLRRDDND